MDILSYKLGQKSGGGGTSNYADLTNKPSINNVELSGNKSLSDLGVQPAGNYLTTETDPVFSASASAGITSSDITNWNGKQNTIQYDTMPTASSSTVGQIVQYVGATNANYTNGYFYIGITDGQDPATYSWENISVQDVDLSNYLAKDNTTAFTPSADYQPATKKYVDDNAGGSSGWDLIITSTNYNDANTIEILNTLLTKHKNGEIVKIAYQDRINDEETSYSAHFYMTIPLVFVENRPQLSWNLISPMYIDGANQTFYDYRHAIYYVNFGLNFSNNVIISLRRPVRKSYLYLGTTTGGTSKPTLLVTNNGTSYDVKQNYHPAHKLYVDTAVSNSLTNIAPAYSKSSTYAVGDYVIYNNVLYVCNTAIETAENWASAHWTQTTVAEIIKNL